MKHGAQRHGTPAQGRKERNTMKREERTQLNGLRRSVNESTIYCEIPMHYTEEGKQALHEMLTVEKHMIALRVNWNPIREEYTVLYAPARPVNCAERHYQEATPAAQVIAGLRVTDTWWNGFRRAD